MHLQVYRYLHYKSKNKDVPVRFLTALRAEMHEKDEWMKWCFLTYTVLDMGVLSHPLTQNPARVTDISHRLVSVPLRDPSQTPGVQSKHYKRTCRRRNIFFWFDVMFFILWYKKIIIICMIIQFPKNIVKL